MNLDTCVTIHEEGVFIAGHFYSLLLSTDNLGVLVDWSTNVSGAVKLVCEHHCSEHGARRNAISRTLPKMYHGS